jgi:single-strand DNA-binding protein
MSSTPRFQTLANGSRVARFSLSTQETFLDDEGNTKNVKSWHQISAWGSWVGLLEKIGESGKPLAIEGKLRSRFYKTKAGEAKNITEVEVNDLVML